MHLGLFMECDYRMGATEEEALAEAFEFARTVEDAGRRGSSMLDPYDQLRRTLWLESRASAHPASRPASQRVRTLCYHEAATLTKVPRRSLC
jgi:hypothetical protein